MILTCPKCQNQMRQQHRGGVTIEQCVGCGGIFLDRGELEHLSQAANSYYGPPPPQQGYAPGHSTYAHPPAPISPVSGPPAYGYGHSDHGHHGHGHYGHKKKKKKSFFEELFDD